MTAHEIAWHDLKTSAGIPAEREAEAKVMFFAGIAWAYSKQRDAAAAGLDQIRSFFDQEKSAEESP